MDLRFPWDATAILSRDERLVELMRAGRFDSLMKNVDEVTRRWAANVMTQTRVALGVVDRDARHTLHETAKGIGHGEP
ncbi:hypothetical protein [Archangium lipolyticum]|uniref:hypothetical protein n=1 Tax=Archangium lipolyticum TaxID=2970465 RepID=UPI002149CC15|nr:hypothetical protein [Archangium lipolyticum]